MRSFTNIPTCEPGAKAAADAKIELRMTDFMVLSAKDCEPNDGSVGCSISVQKRLQRWSKDLLRLRQNYVENLSFDPLDWNFSSCLFFGDMSIRFLLTRMRNKYDVQLLYVPVIQEVPTVIAKELNEIVYLLYL